MTNALPTRSLLPLPLAHVDTGRRRALQWLCATGATGLVGCGGSPSPDAPASPALRLGSRAPLGPAYANSSINASVFRQDAIASLSAGRHAVALFDPDGHVRIDVLSADATVLRSVFVDPPLERRLLADGHCSINLGRSPDGVLQVFHGAHGTLPLHASIEEGVLLDPSGPARVTAAPWERTITYPQMYLLGDELQLWFRSDPDNTVQFLRYDAAGKTFGNAAQPVLSADATTRPYINQLAQLGDRLALSWIYRLPSGDDIIRNEDLHVAWSDDRGASWRTRAGAPLSTPIARTPATLELALPADTRQPLNQTTSCFAPDGTLYVSFYARDDRGLHQIRLLGYPASGPGAPVLETVSDNREAYDLSGAGTLALPLSRPLVVASAGQLHVAYRQGGRLLIASRARGTVGSPWVRVDHGFDGLGFWEPSGCRQAWLDGQRLLLYVQGVRQGPSDTEDVGDPTPAQVLEFQR